MANILLLYDLKEKDLARDFKDLLEEFNIGSVIMIPLSPDRGLTLEDKEKHHFDSADGALFIITPGAERLGNFYPSPSVTHEMGQAKQKFQKKPECAIYLVDEDCKLPAVDQKSYISFNRKDIRSIIGALTQLIKDLKTAGLYRTTSIPTDIKPQPKEFDLAAFSKNLSDQVRQVLFDISNKPEGITTDEDLTNLLKNNYQLDIQSINLLKRELESTRVVIHIIGDAPYANFWCLSELGWAVVRLEVERKRTEKKVSISELLAEMMKESDKKHIL